MEKFRLLFMIIILKNRVDSKHVEGDCFPLCFSSFESLKQRFRSTNQIQEIEIMNEVIAFLEMDDEKEEKSCNQSQHMKKPTICNMGLNHQEKDQGSRSNVSLYLSISESFCQEGFCSLDSFKEQNINSFETHEENQFLNSEILNEVVDVPLKVVMGIPFMVLPEISSMVCK